ncbi:uncharacterized protein N7443_001808 [Penicillium atrosanguineum]|uniref:uncharacterized protein n=1 Tax=Penicillium atrosanguineum TaxID=1132637 RepID=UPI0023A4C2C7|nr:uncharacterized protein N7443_001808 [Penicillium atrosanguineum]KAJ5309347.1 hypothetical protein N7443_001808 [Penicillium atrosanguineum]
MESRHDNAENTCNGGDLSYNFSLGPCEERIRRHFFDGPHQDLLLVHNFLQKLQGTAKRDYSLARFFEVPLISDALAQRMTYMFTDARPKILEACSDDVSWIDVVRESSPEVKYQDGKYHYYLPQRKVRVEVCQFDHHLISAGHLRQLIHPRFHQIDVQTELDALNLMAKEISSWGCILLDMADISQDVLEKVDDMLARLETSSVSPISGDSQAAQANLTDADSSAHLSGATPTEVSVGIPRKHDVAKMPFPPGRRWTGEEKSRVVGWFEPRAHLTDKEIELEFRKDFGHSRTISAIQAILYQKGAGHLRRKKKIRSRSMQPVVEVTSQATSNRPFQLPVSSPSTSTIGRFYLTPSRSPSARDVHSDEETVICSPSQYFHLGSSASCGTLNHTTHGHADTDGMNLDRSKTATSSQKGINLNIPDTRDTEAENSGQQTTNETSQGAEPPANSRSLERPEMYFPTQGFIQAPESVAKTLAPSSVRPTQRILPGPAPAQ